MTTYKNQKGMATLGIALILILIISIGTLYSGQIVLSDTKSNRNEHLSKRALQSADAGISYAMVWLGNPNNTSAADFVWQTDATQADTQVNTKVLTTTNDGYNVAIKIYRQFVASQNFVDGTPTGWTFEIIQLVSTATGENSSSAKVSQKVYLPKAINPSFSSSPIVIQGCLSGVTGTPNAAGVPNNKAAITTSANVVSGCINPGNMGTVPVQLGGFQGSAWDYTFGVSQDQMKAAAGDNTGDTVRYYDASNPAPDNWHDNFGSESNPGVIVFGPGSGCPKINGGPVIYGIVYYDASCGADEGWGNATIYGSVVSGGAITQLTANTQFHYMDFTGPNAIKIPVTAIRIVGTWKDF